MNQSQSNCGRVGCDAAAVLQLLASKQVGWLEVVICGCRTPVKNFLGFETMLFATSPLLWGGALLVLLKSGFLAMFFYTSRERLCYRITFKTSVFHVSFATNRVS